MQSTRACPDYLARSDVPCLIRLMPNWAHVGLGRVVHLDTMRSIHEQKSKEVTPPVTQEYEFTVDTP